VLRSAAIVLAVIASLPATSAETLDALDQWGQWRGPLGTGVAPRANPPVEWSEEQNVRWTAEIPGKGLSSPIVWGDRVFLTTTVPAGEAVGGAAPQPAGAHHNIQASHRLRFVVLAYRRTDGALLWERTVRTDRPHAGTHETGSWASNSAVTDGKHLVVSFGSAGLYGLDLEGELLWSVNLGELEIKHGHGEGSSPALWGNTVVVNLDHEGQSSVVALDKRSGKELWRVARDEGTSWASPLVVEHGERRQVVIAATRRVRGYDLSDGRLIWECGGLSGNVVATPVAADGIVYVANSYETRAMMAISLDAARGDITGTDAVLWTRERDTPYVPSPLLYEGALCFLKHYQGIVTCVHARTGKLLFGPERLPGIRNVYASPAAAGGRAFVVGLDGATLVLEHGPELAVLGVNRLDDSFSASPAIVGEELYLRGDRTLYCIAAD
jgi:outer membrane protein assembly factor BamB